MNRRDVTPIVHAWLHEDAHEDADRVLDSVLSQLDSTQQRRSRWPARRFLTMRRAFGIALTTAAAVLVALVGINLLPGTGGVGGPTASASPTASPSASPADGVLVNGRNSLTVDGIPFSFSVTRKASTLEYQDWTRGPISHTSVPGQWTFGSLYISKTIEGPQGAEAVIYWTAFPSGASATACGWLLERSVGPGAADLAGAVATNPGTELVTGPEEVSVGGRPAQHVALKVRYSTGCQPGFFFTWADEQWGPFWSGIEVGDTISVWIVDVDGVRLFIGGITHEFVGGPGSPRVGPELGQEIQEIVDSIRFE